MTYFALLIPAFSRIGESQEKCEERYGKPLAKAENVARYNYQKYSIIIKFENGAAKLMTYHKMVDKDPEAPDYTAQEIKSVLITQNSKWRKTGDDTWTTLDGKMQAIHDPKLKALVVAQVSTSK